MARSKDHKSASISRARESKSHDIFTFRYAVHRALEEHLHGIQTTRFPSLEYRKDPVRFCHEVLGLAVWQKQKEILEAIRDHDRVTVKSGHKIGKSTCAAASSLWYYCSYELARVIMTSTTYHQVDNILWRELRLLKARGGVCIECKQKNKTLHPSQQIIAPCVHSAVIDGELSERARTGFKSHDFREVWGFTASEAEAVAGISGPNMLYEVDEASGVKQIIFEAIEGNRAGGARVVYYSNPTKTVGEFYESHTSKSKFYYCITVSSEDTPNVRYGDDDPRAIPGLATRKYIAEKEEEYGRDSAFFKVRVLGEFCETEEGRIFSIHDISEAESRWHDTAAEGRLHIGLDPAGPGVDGDESVWALRRGKKIMDLVAMRGLSTESLLMHTLGLCTTHKNDREVPVLVLDREGKIGAETYGVFASFLGKQDDPPFEMVAVRASDKAHRNALVYDRMRDELAAEFFDWVQADGAIPTDTKLSGEMHAYEWDQQPSGRVKITPKKDIRKDLGRSPDRFDACCLSTWNPVSMRDNRPPRKSTISRNREDAPGAPPPMDPYGGMQGPY